MYVPKKPHVSNMILKKTHMQTLFLKYIYFLRFCLKAYQAAFWTEPADIVLNLEI